MQTEAGKIKIGVLSLQGGIIEHINHLKDLAVYTVEVKKATDLDDIDGLILPGGESTTLEILLKTTNMLYTIRDKINNRLPVCGTCAGIMQSISKGSFN